VFACGCADEAGTTPEPRLPDLRIDPDRGLMPDATPRMRAVNLFWVVAAVLTLLYSMLDGLGGMSFFIFGPLVLLAAGLVSMVIVLVSWGPGRWAGFLQTARIVLFTLAFTAVGAGCMGGCLPILVLMK
jgi:hypothetical protein